MLVSNRNEQITNILKIKTFSEIEERVREALHVQMDQNSIFTFHFCFVSLFNDSPLGFYTESVLN